jgi:acyl-CoA reductase-like NAD-dependent aldehyde dehydrogenase
METSRQFIGGQWVAATGGATIDVLDPATGEPIGRIPAGGAADADAAARAARARGA